MKKIYTLLLAFLIIFALMGCQSNEQASPILEVTQNDTENDNQSEDDNAYDEEAFEPYYFKDFELTTLDGEATSLYAYGGQTILLNFWTTNCTYCSMQQPLLDEINKRDDIVVLAVNIGENEKNVKNYIDENQYTFPVFLDKQGKLASEFYVSGVPTTYFIGPDYEYYLSYPGLLTQELLTTILEDIADYQNR